MKISITNHTGCRNRGCEALALSKILGFKKELGEDSEYVVHSNDPVYDAWRLKNKAKTVFSYLIASPNHFKSKILNTIIYKSLAILEKLLPNRLNGIVMESISILNRSDIIISTGGDIFTSDYHNLRKHLSFIVASKNKTIYLCSHTIGPFTKEDEEYFIKIAPNIDLITVRESESYTYLKGLPIEVPVYLTADVAFTLPTLTKEDACNYVRNRFGIDETLGRVSLSISQGIIEYCSLNAKDYYTEFAIFVDYLNAKGKIVLFIPHVMEKNPDKNDLIACEEVFKIVKKPEMNRIISGEPSAVEFKGIIGITECLIGTRTHSTIAALSQCVPTVSVAYSRKAYGIMKDIFGDKKGEELTVAAKGLKAAHLISAYEAAILTPPDYKIIQNIKTLANENFSKIREIL